MRIIKIIILFCLIASSSAFGQNYSDALDNFLKSYIEAIKSNNPNELMKLAHPKCLKYLQEEKPEYLRRYYRDTNYPDIKFASYEIDEYADEGDFEGKVYYPVKPTHLLIVRFKKYHGSITRHETLVYENDKFYFTNAVPKDEYIEYFNELREELEKASKSQ